MNEFSAHLKSSLRIALLFLSASLLAWALLPAYRHYLSGLLIGTAAGVLSAAHLAWRVHRLAESVVSTGQARRSTGFSTRAALAVLAAFVALKLGYSVIAAIAGLFFVQLATLLLGIAAKRSQ